ncbi:hypothetical protein O181_090681 [Austropuccinia psidii MF-1]|uniref:Uncharacterized protein n=1 Tax=Austropuccinia psidii MF-1 TaxID=1389203 RepID=A0A9Q3IW17_9BASI|nr:hypothetical protein [Austropuccinia psidii MF-1]
MPFFYELQKLFDNEISSQLRRPWSMELRPRTLSCFRFVHPARNQDARVRGQPAFPRAALRSRTPPQAAKLYARLVWCLDDTAQDA